MRAARPDHAANAAKAAGIGASMVRNCYLQERSYTKRNGDRARPPFDRINKGVFDRLF